ncbi:hypothetical protein [Rhizobium sp. GCM10022189]|uniref:hypothetical protein n=1 Tax=Rhizobium sp. GCM10022189 TaxID=3252654 RepID=UPI003620A1CF
MKRRIADLRSNDDDPVTSKLRRMDDHLLPDGGSRIIAHFCWNCSLSHAIPDAKPLHTFAGIAFASTQFRTQNRFTLLLELL